VKNQYFGDTRDLFKYDLALRILEGVPSLRSFTFVPMLTPDDGSGDGGRVNHGKAKAGHRNTALVQYLEECIRDNRRNIREIGPFFRERGITVHIHGPGFSHRERAGYFETIPASWLRDSLVFLDPDVGLGVARPTEKHLLFPEVEALAGRLGGASVLMIFQFFPRVERQAYLDERIRDLREIALEGIAAIADTQVAFFFLGREPGVVEGIRELLAGYREEYPHLIVTP